MGSFGERLKREREMRSVTLEEISEATKIGTRSLRALEQEDFDQLPGGIFNKGFVRAYARYLGLDEDQAVADYLAALGEAIAAGKVTRQEPTAAPAVLERNLLISDLEGRPPLRLPLRGLAILVLLALAVFGGWRYYARHGLPRLWHVRAATTPPRPPAPPSPKLQTAIPGAEDGFVVRVKAKRNSWVSITADGQLVMEGTLVGASEKAIRAQRSVVVKAGNAAAIELFHNNKPVPPLGKAGEVKTVEFTAAGLRQ